MDRKNDKLIAEFMGWKTHPEHGENYLINKNKDRKIPYWCDYNMEIPLDELNYTQSWDWLMPVVEKINNIKIKDYRTSVYIHKEKCVISVTHFNTGRVWNISISSYNNEYSNIERCYLAIVEFVKYYNEQK